MTNIGKLRENLIKIKNKLSLTNNEIADDIGCSESTICEIISGRRKNIVPRTYFTIEKWLLTNRKVGC